MSVKSDNPVFSMSVFYENMQQYQKAIGETRNSRRIATIATKCLGHAQANLPKDHLLMPCFKKLETMLEGDETTDDEIVNHVELIADLVGVIAKRSSSTPTARVEAAPSPAAPPAPHSSGDASRYSEELDRLELQVKADGILAARSKDKSEIAELKKKNDRLESQLNELAKDANTRIDKLTASTEKSIENLALKAGVQFAEFWIPNWSKIPLGLMEGDPAGTLPYIAILFSNYKSPLNAWGQEFWLKVEKTAARIGLYLCCKKDVEASTPERRPFEARPFEARPFALPAHHSHNPAIPNQDNFRTPAERWPFDLQYQLMAKKCGSTDGVCASAIFKTIFGKESAWGLRQFATEEILEREGAYNKKDDMMIFGCAIYPGEKLLWGQNIVRLRPPRDEASPAISPPTIPPAAPATTPAAPPAVAETESKRG